MRRRFVLLAIALTSLVALGVLGALTGGSSPSQQPASDAPAAGVDSTAPTRAPTTDALALAAQTEEAAEDTGAPAAPATGCGWPVPCPNRDCADCPANIYLK